MPRRSYVVEDDATPQIIDARVQDVPEEETEAREQSEAFEKTVLEEFGITDNAAEYVAWVYRLENGKRVYIEQVGIDAFPIQDRLKKMHGGGVFQIFLKKDGKIFKNKMYHVERASPGASPAPSQISELGELMRAQTEQIARLIGGAPAGALSPPPDPLAQMKQMMEIMALMKSTMEPPKGTDIKDFLALFAAAKELAADGGNNGRTLADVFVELFKSGAVNETLQTLKAQTAPPRAAPAPAAQRAPGALAAPAPPVADPTPAPFDDLARRIERQLQTWHAAAMRGGDAELYAELAFDEYGIDAAMQVLAREDLEQIAVNVVPGFANPKALQWLRELVAHAKNILTEMQDAGDDNHHDAIDDTAGASADDVAVDSSGAGGNQSDVARHGETREGVQKRPDDSTTGGKAHPKSSAKGSIRRTNGVASLR